VEREQKEEFGSVSKAELRSSCFPPTGETGGGAKWPPASWLCPDCLCASYSYFDEWCEETGGFVTGPNIRCHDCKREWYAPTKLVCTDPDHFCFPVYGVAPHECFYKKGPEFLPGQSSLLPRDQWPDNFVLEVMEGEDPATITYPNACGTYYCPTCKAGMPAADVAPEARATAQTSPDGEGAQPIDEVNRKPTDLNTSEYIRTQGRV
jgi:hypothetical protein